MVWNQLGFYLVTVLSRRQKLMDQYYINNVVSKICRIPQSGGRRRVIIHVDNARPHVVKMVKQFMDVHELRAVLHPPDSPDLAPSDFFLFGHVQGALHGSVLETVEELLEDITSILNAIQPETLLAVFHEWMDKLQTCINYGGEYVT
jgi:histone-lysine N-methyltransferase SETMAR